MRTENEEYSKSMLGEANETPVDDDLNYTMEMPEWADQKKIKMAQKFFLLNINAMVRTLYVGLFAVAASPTLLNILMFTKQSSTPALAYRRYKANALHAKAWYMHPIKPGTKAWKSLETVRKMHVVVNRRSTKAGEGIISQKDMSITLFAFLGFNLLSPDKFGIVGTREQFEAFNHFWRVIGYLLGTEDKYNCCGETLDDTLSRLRSIRDDMLVPALTLPSEAFESYSRIALEGMWHSEPTLHYESVIFMMKRAMNMPGYHYFESEASGDKQMIKQLSWYTHFRVLLDIIVFEYLTHVFIFRWIFNIMRFVFARLLDRYPALALRSFGKKYAYVEIMKAKK